MYGTEIGFHSRHGCNAFSVGALNAQAEEMTFVVGGRNGRQLFDVQLQSLVKRNYPNADHMHLSPDNVGRRSSSIDYLTVPDIGNRTTRCLRPSWCPWLNRIKRVWKRTPANQRANGSLVAGTAPFYSVADSGHF